MKGERYVIPSLIEAEIKRALFQMRSRKAPGLTMVPADAIKKWYYLSHPTEGKVDESAMEKWKKVVRIVQKCIGEGEVPEAFSKGVLVVIPKDDCGGVRGIGLLEAIHKLISQIINLRMSGVIQFCAEVHGFRKKRGTYTAIGETKILMQMATCRNETTYQIYLDLRKTYDSIDRGRILKLMEKYKVGPRLRRYVKKVWDNQFFVLRQGGFYSEEVPVQRGCIQGDTNSPIIFNLIIDAVLRTWKQEGGKSRASFYADDGLVENTEANILQKDLDTLIELFERVGLETNEIKTKYMIIRGAAAPKAMTKEVYDKIKRRGRKVRWKDGRDRQAEKRRARVQCRICNLYMCQGSLDRHMKEQHNITSTQYPERKVSESGEYEIGFVKNSFNACPVENCSGGGRDKFGLYRHFCLRHPGATLIIRGDKRLDKCELCGMQAENMKKHQNSSTCRKARKRRENEVKQDQQKKAEGVEFHVNGKVLSRVREFTYLGRVFTEKDDDSICIERQIKKAKQRWYRIANILKREGANAICMARFYVTVVQAVLLYGADSWVVTEKDMNKLESFHKRAIRHMTGTHICKLSDKEWVFPDHSELLLKCRLFPMSIYLERRRGTLREYIEKNRGDLIQKMVETDNLSRGNKKLLWWDQKFLTKAEMTEKQSLWDAK